MKKLLVLSLSVILTGALLVTGCSSSWGEGKSIGTVNGVDISDWQYQLQYEQNKAYMEQFGVDFENEESQAMLAQIEQYAWEYAISNALLVQVAQEEGITVSDSEAKKLLEDSIAESFESDADYQTWLTDNDMTEKQVLELFRLQKYNELLYEKITADITAGEEEAKTAYEKDPTAYDYKTTSHILIAAEEGTATAEEMAAAKAQAEDIIKQLNEGADFATLAKEYSADGSAEAGGIIETKITAQTTGLYAEYVKETFALSGEGSYSRVPIKTDAGYHILKIDTEKIGFAAVKEELMNSLAEEAKAEAYNDFMAEKREGAEILRAMAFTYWTEGNELYATVAGYTDPAPTQTPAEPTPTDESAASDESTTNSINTKE